MVLVLDHLVLGLYHSISFIVIHQENIQLVNTRLLIALGLQSDEKQMFGVDKPQIGNVYKPMLSG